VPARVDDGVQSREMKLRVIVQPEGEGEGEGLDCMY